MDKQWSCWVAMVIGCGHYLPFCFSPALFCFVFSGEAAVQWCHSKGCWGSFPQVVWSEVKVTGSLRGACVRVLSECTQEEAEKSKGGFCVLPYLMRKGDPLRRARLVVLVVSVSILYRATLPVSWASRDLQTRHHKAEREGCETTLWHLTHIHCTQWRMFFCLKTNNPWTSVVQHYNLTDSHVFVCIFTCEIFWSV